MNNHRTQLVIASAIALAAALCPAGTTQACGGLFCQLVPIDQAGEQIIFRQDGSTVTAVVLIQYAGDAADFSWVVPVPGVPVLSTGSDLLFGPLELATRPQFILETTGDFCPDRDQFFGGAVSTDAVGSAPEDEGGVTILESLAVGPFDVQIVSSDDADALATWLEENNYDLSDRGRDLIAPYVEEGMNFVALRLQQNQGVGDIQPLIMRYQSEQPMIPIRLTAVAALEDMGVIVWLLGESRAVPLNYYHVTPNYTRLNWYAGSTNAYASYQGLITAAMNEAGGQGFATDYAGRMTDLLTSLPTVESLTDELVRLSSIEDDAGFIVSLAGGFVFAQDKVLESLRRALPLPEGEDEFIYRVPELLADTFTTEQLTLARADLIIELNDTVIGPLEESLGVFDGDPYMTRLYTTLSPEEMTLDPIFSFNPDLDDQQLDRNATMHTECGRWTLTLGKGTGRDGELVIDGVGSPPGFTAPTIDQDSVLRTESLATSGPGEVITQKQFAVAQVTDGSTPPTATLCGVFDSQGGLSLFGLLGMTMLGLRFGGRSGSSRQLQRI